MFVVVEWAHIFHHDKSGEVERLKRDLMGYSHDKTFAYTNTHTQSVILTRASPMQVPNITEIQRVIERCGRGSTLISSVIFFEVIEANGNGVGAGTGMNQGFVCALIVPTNQSVVQLHWPI